MPHLPPLIGHSAIYDEIVKDLANTIHAAGLWVDRLGAQTPGDELLVVCPHPNSRAVIISPTQDYYLMICMNDALTEYLYGEGWVDVLRELRLLEDGESKGLDMSTNDSGQGV